jgi:hypothetical protein
VDRIANQEAPQQGVRFYYLPEAHAYIADVSRGFAEQIGRNLRQGGRGSRDAEFLKCLIRVITVGLEHQGIRLLREEHLDAVFERFNVELCSLDLLEAPSQGIAHGGSR